MDRLGGQTKKFSNIKIRSSRFRSFVRRRVFSGSQTLPILSRVSRCPGNLHTRLRPKILQISKFKDQRSVFYCPACPVVPEIYTHAFAQKSFKYQSSKTKARLLASRVSRGVPRSAWDRQTIAAAKVTAFSTGRIAVFEKNFSRLSTAQIFQRSKIKTQGSNFHCIGDPPVVSGTPLVQDIDPSVGVP